MIRIIRANLFRMIHSRIFWGCVLLSLGFSFSDLFFGIRNAANAVYWNAAVHVDDNWFNPAPFMGGILAVFVSFFLGSQMSNHTIRNKLIAGYARSTIYLADWISCLLAAFVFMVLWYLVQIPGLFLISPFYMSLEEFVIYTGLALLMMIAFTSLYTFVSLSTNKQATGLLINLVLWLAMTAVAAYLLNRLSSPEMLGGMSYVNGEFIMVDPTPNPYHPTGWLKVLFEWIYALLPSGLAITLARVEVQQPAFMAILSAGFSLFFTMAGILTFRQRDIK